MKRGEVYYADLSPCVGCEQGGMRPVVIIQNDIGNIYAQTVIIVPMTASYKKDMSTHVRIGKTDRMDPNTIILAEQIRTIDKSRIRNYVCLLHKETMENLDSALKISIGLKEKEGRKLDDFKVFENKKFGTVRAIIGKDGKPWFVAKDVTTVLGIQGARDAVDRHVEKEDQGTIKNISPDGTKSFAVINEAGVWSLVLGVNGEFSRDFQKWVSLEIIPEITGRKEKEMDNAQVFESSELGLQVRTILNDDGSISVNAEDTAVGFGWCRTEMKNGKEYHSVRWATLNGYCKEFGFANSLAKDDYIPESLFYRLGMKANNAVADRFQNWLAMDVIPSIRKTGGYKHKRMSPEEMMRVQLGMLDGHEERISKLEGTMNIDYGQQRVLEKEVAKVVIDALGGKESTAYRELSRKVFSECNHDVKDYFHVNSRNNIPRVRFDDAVEYIQNWTPCTNTKAAIYEKQKDVANEKQRGIVCERSEQASRKRMENIQNRRKRKENHLLVVEE